MNKMIAYFNCFSGVSGDMLLGTLVDAGAQFEELKKKLAMLPVRGYELTVKKVKRAGIRATKVDVVLKTEARAKNTGHRQKEKVRRWKDIEKIIRTSKLSDEIKQKGLFVFRRLFEAEAKVHGEKVQDVHLHELGAVDCIVDIMGTLIGLELLGIKTVYSSPLNLGSGTIKTTHGTLPVPAPATAQLLKGAPVYSSGTLFELTTPTGAVLMSSLAEKFGPMPDMHILKTATGAGGQNFKDQPNVLMMIMGEQTGASSQQSAGKNLREEEKVTVIETNIDDMNPQVYEYVMEKLLKAGALDVFLTQTIMKKGRPGIVLSVLCREEEREKLTDIVLNETTSIGVRFYRAERTTLRRELRPVKTKYGKVNIKIAYSGKKISKVSTEYEDCKKLARKYDVPLAAVMKEALRAV
ncbi:MAG: nickel pincer cofactor biosynthesis protein LarC [Nitrospiraceae bacterium]|nr:MAG: nickel pincer cofactor biosynthesis protein LarC [Nitrospiraceae bacterium]